MSNLSLTPTIDVLVLTDADTEYAFEIPEGTVQLQFSVRSGNAARYSYTAGVVASPDPAADAYITLSEQTAYGNDQVNNTAVRNIYFAASTAGEVIEIELWRSV